MPATPKATLFVSKYSDLRKSMRSKEHILYCDCASCDFLAREEKERIIGALEGSGLPCSLVADLCRLCADGDERLREWAGHEKLFVVACYPRAVQWLFHAGGVELDPSRVEFFNVRQEDGIARLLERLVSGSSGEKGCTEFESSGDWVPWFPVIDESRCTNCQKCLEFCLFGTYALSSEGRIQVEKPRACKTNCPACARICPQKAIIFPKHDSAPINGAPATDDPECEQIGIDHARLFQGDIYKKIKERGKRKRFSKDAPAEGEMAGLREQLGIPPDVLAGLSPDEIAHVRKRLKEDGEDALEDEGEGNLGG